MCTQINVGQILRYVLPKNETYDEYKQRQIHMQINIPGVNAFEQSNEC